MNRNGKAAVCRDQRLNGNDPHGKAWIRIATETQGLELRRNSIEGKAVECRDSPKSSYVVSSKGKDMLCTQWQFIEQTRFAMEVNCLEPI